MFFKVIYYLLGIGIVLYELGMLGKFKDYVNDSFDFLQWNKNKKVIKLSVKRLKISKDETSLLKYF